MWNLAELKSELNTNPKPWKFELKTLNQENLNFSLEFIPVINQR